METWGGIASMWKYFKVTKSNEAKAQLLSDQLQISICIWSLRKAKYMYSSEY